MIRQVCLAAAVAAVAPATALNGQDDSAFVVWGRSRATPIDSIGAGAIAALGPRFDPVRLVGVGESVHNVRQFLEIRLTLLEELVRRHRVTALALESGLPEAMALDAWVAGRADTVDFAAALTYGFGELEVVRRVFRWLRAWNLGPGRAAPVRVIGVDLARSAGSMIPALDRLVELTDDPGVRDAVAALRPLALRVSGPFWRPAALRYDSLGPAVRDSLRLGAGRLVEAVGRARLPDPDRARWVHRLALLPGQLEEMLRLGAYHPDNPRDRAMAANTRWVLDQLRPGERAVLWAHNAHVQRVPIEGPVVPAGTPPSMGFLLGRELGAGYLAIGFGYGGPSLDSATAPVAGGVDQALGAVRAGPYLLPLGGAPAPASRWLDRPRPIRFQAGHLIVPLGRAFDAMVYVDRAEFAPVSR
jgi:erythromycin esterase